MRPGVTHLPTHIDDRGSVFCVMDWMHTKGIKRTYTVTNFSKGMIRAWHGHKEAHTYMHVVSGAVKIAALNMANDEDLESAVLTGEKPQIFYVPPGFYNGAISLTDNTKIMVYSTLTFDEVKNDNYRESYNVRGDIWEVKNR